MGLPTLLRTILGFPHPENISPRGTPVGVLVHDLTRDLAPTKPRSYNVAESPLIRARRPSLLRSHHAFHDTHTNGRSICGS